MPPSPAFGRGNLEKAGGSLAVFTVNPASRVGASRLAGPLCTYLVKKNRLCYAEQHGLELP